MSPRSNPMSRVASILQRALQTPPRGNGLATWAVVFGLGDDRQALSEADTLRSLALLHEQVDLAQRTMRQAGVEANTLNSAFAQINQAIAVSTAMAGWNQVQQVLSANSPITSLAVAGQMHRADEQLLAPDDLADVDAAIDTFSTAIAALPDDDPLRWFLAEQLAVIRRARRDYVIAGAEALRAGIYQLDGALRNQFGIDSQPTPAAPQTEEQRDAVRAGTSLSRVMKTALMTTGLVASLGAAVGAAEHIASSAARAEVYYLTSGAPALDLAIDEATAGEGD